MQSKLEITFFSTLISFLFCTIQNKNVKFLRMVVMEFVRSQFGEECAGAAAVAGGGRARRWLQQQQQQLGRATACGQLGIQRFCHYARETERFNIDGARENISKHSEVESKYACLLMAARRCNRPTDTHTCIRTCAASQRFIPFTFNTHPHSTSDSKSIAPKMSTQK